MTLEEKLQSLIHETYATHYLLRNLEFPADDIYIGAAYIANAVPPGLRAYVLVKQADKEFRYTLTPLLEQEVQPFFDAWSKFVNEKDQKTNEELDRVVHNSDTWQSKLTIMAMMVAKGFTLPGVESEEDLRHINWMTN